MRRALRTATRLLLHSKVRLLLLAGCGFLGGLVSTCLPERLVGQLTHKNATAASTAFCLLESLGFSLAAVAIAFVAVVTVELLRRKEFGN